MAAYQSNQATTIRDVLRSWSGGWLDFGRDQSALVTTAAVAGLVAFLFIAIRVALNLLQVVRLYFLSQYCFRGTNFVKKYGNWAVISGATDGIGQAMAKELAERGMSIVVIGRSDEKLARTKAMLEQVPNAGQIETLKVDLSGWSMAIYERVCSQLEPENRDIGVLINCAGMGPDKFQDFNSFEASSILTMMNTNGIAPMCLTRMIMPGMLKRTRGLIMNVSSMSASIVWPNLGAYPASKAFVNTLTRQLRAEYESCPIDVVLLHTGPVYTKLADPFQKRRPNFLVPTPDKYARSTINALSAGAGEYSGMLVHDIVILAMSIIYKVGLWRYCVAAMTADRRKHYEPE